MNGLQFIRTRCNISASALAEHLGVTRQMICAWENGRKEIPEKRKEELAEYFGIEKRYLGEISKADREKLIHSAMYYYVKSPGREQLRFGADGSGEPVYVDDEKFESIDQKLRNAKDREAELIEGLKEKIRGRGCVSIMDEVHHIEQSCEILEYADKFLDAIWKKKGHDRQMLRYEIKDMFDAFMIFLGYKSTEGVEEEVYSSEGILRVSSFGVDELLQAIQKNHAGYQKEYQTMYSPEKKEHVIYTYGIRKIDNIVRLFGDEYDVFRTDECFTDVIATNCDAVFMSPESLDTEEYYALNEVFRYGGPPVIFTGEPWYRLDFRYYLVDSGQREDLAASILKSMIPVRVRHEIEKKEAQEREEKAASDEERIDALIRDYSTDEGEIDEKDHTLINQAAMTIIKLPHNTMQKLLIETDNRRLAVAMKGWRGKTRAKVFENISPRLRGQLAEDMEYLGPVRMKDVEKETAWIMRKLIETDQENEYPELKVVLDIYDSKEGEDHGED